MSDRNARNYGTTSSQSEASSSSSPPPTSSKSSVYDDEAQIPPPDRGKAAWLFLFGCFWLEGLVWGNVLWFVGKKRMLNVEKDCRFPLGFLKDSILRMNRLLHSGALLP